MISSEEIYSLFLEYPQISTDSRNILPGSIFIGLKGDRFDGNLFARDAIKQGAALAIIDNKDMAFDERFILVPDTIRTLQELATIHRRNIQAKVIGITGSNGKTTTKELIGKVLSSSFQTAVTPGNLNNHIGVPLTILSLKKEEFAVVEMGANHPGEIASLSEIAKPGYGIITNIGKAHLEGFGSIEGVEKAKSELYEYIKRHDGLLFVNTDHDRLARMAAGAEIVTYGTNPGADCTGLILKSFPALTVGWNGQELNGTVETNLYGEYNFENVLAAITVGLYFGVQPGLINNAIKSYVPQNNRSQWEKTQNNMLLLDAYNANPSSMRAALMSFDKLDAPLKIVILGDMMELGEESFKEHADIVNLLRSMSFGKIILIGENFYRAAGKNIETCFKEISDAEDWLSKNKIHNSTVLLKGSRQMQLEKLKKLL